jgi:ACS family glucarate transporter-like MFS transporter
MFGFAALAYVQRTTISVAAPELTSALQLSKQQIGWLFLAFTAAYAAAQLPGGALGQRFGPHAVFTGVGLLGVIATLATALSPYVVGGAALLGVLLLAQALLGLGQGPIFPVFATVVERWFPSRQFALANGTISSGMLLGGALTPPLLVAMIAALGWQQAILLTALPPLLLTVLWWRFGRDRPQQHARVTPAELAELDAVPPAPPLTFARMRGVLLDRNILLLALSYLCMNVVFYMISFWSFMYLVEQRGLKGLESGVMAMIPWIGAAVGAAVGGVLADRLAARYGATRGYRLLPLVSLPIGAVMLVAIPAAGSALLAVAALTLAFFAMEVNEGPYWAATMRVARADTGAATGVLNTGGNIGGIVCQPMVAALVAGGDWTSAWVIGAAFAALAAVLWLFVRCGESAEASARQAERDAAFAASGLGVAGSPADRGWTRDDLYTRG